MMPNTFTPQAPVDDVFTSQFEGLGYEELCQRGKRGVCGIHAFVFTGALVVGIDQLGYEGRYCYPSMAEASEALAQWDGEKDPPGNWIKYKGRGGERLGPGCEV